MRQILNESRQGLKASNNVTNLLKRSSSLIEDVVSFPYYYPGFQKRGISYNNSHLNNNCKQTKYYINGQNSNNLVVYRTLSSAAVQDTSHFHQRIPSWETHMVESNGDYREEAFLEKDDVIGGNLYKNQSSLPLLPIPEVVETIERFLPTALPLARNQEEEKALKSACETFPIEAEKLQQRLIARREHEMKNSSWLQLW